MIHLAAEHGLTGMTRGADREHDAIFEALGEYEARRKARSR